MSHSLFSFSELNQTQKLGIFLSSAIAVLLVLLHFPFDGYENEHYVITQYATEYCPTPTIEQVRAMTEKDLREQAQKADRCNNKGEMELLPFSEWRSRGYIVPWFSSPLHTLIGIIFTFFPGALLCWIFRTQKNG